MKRFALLVLLGMVAASCNNELNLNADFQDIGLVYGLLDPKQDTQWVRIHRTYLGTGAPNSSVDIPDSIYYDSLAVVIEAYNSAGGLVATYPLVVDSNSRQLDTGIFTTEEYHLYRTTAPILATQTYKLIIRKLDGGPTITATTNIAGKFEIQRPLNTVSWGSDNTFSAEFQYTTHPEVFAYQPFLRMYYTEQDIDNPSDTVQKFLDYRFPLSTPAQGVTQVKEFLDHEAYLNFLRASLPVNNQILRFFRKFEVYALGAAEDFYTFSRVNAPATGIVTERPEFTNLTNAYGIFSSRTRWSTTDRVEVGSLKRFLAISPQGLQSIVLSDATCALRFARLRNLGPIPDTCYCGGNGIEVCN